MKKKKLKALTLKKASISKLSGGATDQAPTGPITIPLTRYANQCYQTWNIYACTWHSELQTACHCLTEWENTCNFD